MKKISIIALLLGFSIGYPQEIQNPKLWFYQPSSDMEENALPIAYARLAAMIYDNVDKQLIQLNEHTMRSGSPNRNDNPAALKALPSIRKLIFEGKHKQTQKLANQTIFIKKSHGQMFQHVGNLNLVFDGCENFTNYDRELAIQKAAANAAFTVGDVSFTCEAFASFTNRVSAMRIAESKSGSLYFATIFTSLQEKKTLAKGENPNPSYFLIETLATIIS